ncbi:MAG: single-stranded DNA-binding protein, partial [Enterococcus faecalis]
NFQLLESKEVNEQRRGQSAGQATFDKQPTEKDDPLDPFVPGNSPIEISDDDLPF